MKMKLKELKQLVRENLAKLLEDYEVGSDDKVNLEDPVVLWNNTFGMDDQETSTKIANRRINLNDLDATDDSFIATQALLQKEGKKDSNGCETPFFIDKYAKKKSKRNSKKMSMKEALPPQFIKKMKDKKAAAADGSDSDDCKDKKKKKKVPPQFIKGKQNTEDKYPSKAGWQGERDDDDDKAKKRKKMRAQLKGKSNPMKGPVKNTREPKVSEDKYPDKDGWQGETYRDPNRRTKPGKKKKMKTPLKKATKPDSFSMTQQLKKAGKKISNRREP